VIGSSLIAAFALVTIAMAQSAPSMFARMLTSRWCGATIALDPLVLMMIPVLGR
jgi:hypothetical protein